MGAPRSIIIIGGGVIGLSTAYYAVRRGHRAVIVERGASHQDGCSFGNAGLIVPSHFIPLAAPGMIALGLRWMWSPDSPFTIKPRLSRELLTWAWRFYRAASAAHVERSAPLLRSLNLESRACFEELAALPGCDFGFTKKGLLVLCRSRTRLEEEARTAGLARKLGLAAEVLSPEETAKLEPALRMQIAGSVYFPQDCHLSPQRFMAALRSLLEKAGTTFQVSTEAIGWRLDGRRIAALQTTRGEITGDEYVLCGGSWSPALARGLRLRLPIQAGKGYSLTLPAPRRLPAIPCLLAEARVAVTPMDRGLRFGGTMEIAGLDESISWARVEGLIRSACQYFPEFSPGDFQGVHPWQGLRPCSPDGLPYLGRPSSYDNLTIAAGHAKMGLSMGPITGKLVAAILSGERPSLDLTLLDPDRYGLRR